MYVYKTTNLINGKIYIGVSKKPSAVNPLYLGSGKALKASVKKYGRQNFVKEILIENSNFCYKNLQELEIHYIAFYDSQNPRIGYNISKGGDGNDGVNNGMFGKTHSKETIAKIIKTREINKENNPNHGKMSLESKEKFSKFISERNRKSPTLPNGHNDETKSKIANTLKQMAKEGKLHNNHAKFTEGRKKEYSEKFSGDSNPFYGKTHSEESKEKIRNIIRSKFPPVKKLDCDGNIIKIYEKLIDLN
jgi:group I intron endonuclease